VRSVEYLHIDETEATDVINMCYVHNT